MITGIGPGIGRSTLAEGLAARACELGQQLDLFGELQIFTRPAFAEIGQAFLERRDGLRVYPSAEMLLDGYRRLINGLGEAGVVFDWSCLGMISELPWAEGRPDVLLTHASDVLSLAGPLETRLELERRKPRAVSTIETSARSARGYPLGPMKIDAFRHRPALSRHGGRHRTRGLSMRFWLIVFGVNAERWKEQAGITEGSV